MPKVEDKDYREAILKAYNERLKNNIILLSDPTETNVHSELLRVLSSPLPKEDMDAIRDWYGIHSNKDLFNCIKEKKVNKFKSLSEFLKGKKNTLNILSLNVIAILINFNPRPFSKFKSVWNGEALTMVDEEQDSQTAYVEENVDENFSVKETLISETLEEEKTNPEKENLILKWGVPIILASALIVTAYHFMGRKEKSCMAWMGEKYEIVPCNTQFLDQKGITVQVNNGTVNIENFRAIDPNQQTDFYDGSGNPLVWYANNPAGNPEFFNQRGSHPITNAPLKPVPMQLVARYKHDTVIGKGSQIGGSPWEEKQIIPENNYINKNFINSDDQETAVLAFSEKEIDAALIYTISDKFSEMDKKVIPLFYPQNFTVAEKEAFAMGDFSGVPNLENYVDDIMVASAKYDFRKNSTKETLLVCNMDLTYFFYSTRNKTKSQTKSLSVVGSGFSEEEAKQNALKKFML